MQQVRSRAQESAEDLYFGQVVANWARWFIIVAGMLLVLWTADETNKVVLGIIPVVGLLVINFYLHGRHLSGRPANRSLISLASLIDLALITMVVIIWPDANGIESPFFVMYYPVVLAFAFIMPPTVALPYTFVAIGSYVGAVFIASPDVFTDVAAIEGLVTRLITLGSMGALGAYYWRIQRDRRRNEE